MNNEPHAEFTCISRSSIKYVVEKKIKINERFVFQDVRKEAKTPLHFVKLHAPFHVLCQFAEELNLRAPIQVS